MRVGKKNKSRQHQAAKLSPILGCCAGGQGLVITHLQAPKLMQRLLCSSLFSAFVQPCRQALTLGLLLFFATCAQASNIGRDWALVSPLPTANNFNDVAWTGTNLVAVGQGGVLMTSANGIAWSLSQVDTYPYSLAWSGTKMVMGTANNGHVMTSPDGLVWTEFNTNYAGALRKVEWTGTQFIAIGQDDGQDDALLRGGPDHRPGHYRLAGQPPRQL